MRWRPLTWLLLSVMFFIAAVYFWRLGDQWAAKKAEEGIQKMGDGRKKEEPASGTNGQKAGGGVQYPVFSKQYSASGLGGNLNSPGPVVSATNRPVQKNSPLANRLSNTTASMKELAQRPHAILLENALLDTDKGNSLALPGQLRSQGDPGTYIAQSKTALNDDFRAMLKAAGATIVSYIPNNAYLVRASAEAAQQIAADPRTQAVPPYEPYYKLKPSLLSLAVDQLPLPEQAELNVLLFADAREATLPELEKLGAEILGESPTPFGPMVKVRPPPDSLPALAALHGVQIVELSRARVSANDLSRATIGVAADSVTSSNYLGLTGSNILVNINDTGVDATHPDLTDPAPKVLSDALFSLVDTNGHGTHVAGIIAGTGRQSTNVTGAAGSIMPGRTNQFRGKAPGAKLFSVWYTNADFYLQQTAARTNALISNNSWTYAGNEYDIAAASFDAAVRDSLPLTNGSSPVLYVFAAGNSGDINVFENGAPDGGTGGTSDSIQSPATAKNVLTVGAIEQPRRITNNVCLDSADTNTCSAIWLAKTDAADQVAGFSSRGNVGIGFEGEFGRYKPDVMAPGTFVISTRSSQWDQGAYYNTTNQSFDHVLGLVLNSHATFNSGIFVPDNAVQLIVRILTNRPLPGLPIYVTSPNNTTTVKTNQISLPPDAPLNPVGGFWLYTVSNPTLSTLTFDLETVLVTTNDHGNYFMVLSNLNNSLENSTNGTHYYRYESGTSMAAADAAGTLALMQEFFEQRARLTNSPALMKALLINGARSVGDAYSFQVKNNINYQGWGLINLPNSIPASISNQSVRATGPSPMFLFDQSPTNALATGESHTRLFKLNNSAAQNLPLRFTLVWTDPPGNPAASIKLVNDLDLIVTNLDNTNVFYGNDILAGNDFNFAWDTNSVPNVDLVNNVENIYLKQPLGSNYSVTVVGRRVNVNAVTQHTNDVAQDYALVVSSGDGQVSNALSLVETRDVFSTQPFVLVLTNSFAPNATNAVDPNANQVSGGFVLHQHVGANTPLRGTNLVAISNDANAVLTVGMTNQWHFYVLSNEFSFTNAAFVTFLPPELSVARMGVTNVDNPDNATRPEADIDLYVSTDPGLTNLSPVALSNAFKSLSRGGTELVVISSNAQPTLYYIGVKSEDQESAEYDFIGIFSQLPFGSTDTNGNVILRGVPVPAVIPPGTPPNPQAALVLAIDVVPMEVRRVVVTNSMTFDLPGNLLGNLSHNTKFAVLNNHTCATDATGECITNRHDYIYEDNGEGNVPGSRRSDGPGSLKDFIGEQAIGLWLFTMVNNFPSGSGEIDQFTIKLEKSDLDSSGSTTRTLLPNTWTLDSILVPANATNLTVCVTGNTDPVELYIRYGAAPDTNNFDYHLTVNPPGDCLSISTFDIPPLRAGRYYIGVFNPSLNTQRIRLFATITLNPFSIESVVTSSGGPTPIQDDAVTYSYLTNLSHLTISALDVGVLIQHPRISDLSLTLVAPDGTRVLLFEDRGALSTNGLGTFSVTTNGSGEPVFSTTNMTAFYTNNFERSLVGPYAPGAVVFEGWNVLTNFVTVLPDWLLPWQSNNIMLLTDGVVSNALPTTNATQYRLSFKVSHAPYLVGTVGWWPFDRDSSFAGLVTNTPPLATDIFGGHDGLLCGNPRAVLGEVNGAFQGDGVYTSVKVPACSDLDVGTRRGFSIEGWINPSSPPAVTGGTPMSNGFENAPQTRTTSPTGTILSGWLVESGDVAIFFAGYGFTGPPDSPDSGTNALSLNGAVAGSVSTNFTTAPGITYVLSFAYTKDASPLAPGYPFHVSSAQVEITGQPTIPFSYGASNDYNHMNWAHTSMVFTATSPSTKLKFAGTTVGQYGIILDSIKVSVPTAATNASPLVEWYDATNIVGTNVIPSQQGVQFWLGGLPGTNALGALYANIWDTNFQPHIISTVPDIITNDGWQHVALTYDARTFYAQLYTNGHLAISQQISTTNFVSRTGGDLYFGYHNSTNLQYTAAFRGGLDEFALYDRPLSDCEVLAIYSATNRGKYGTNVLLCPVTNAVELLTTAGTFTFGFTNGLGWITNGLTWETNTINFNNPLLAPTNSAAGTNLAGIIVSNLDPNVAVDDFVLSGLLTNNLDGLLHFTDDTNLAFVPIKFAPSPYLLTNFPPTLIFSNDFENATAKVYQAGNLIRGGTNSTTVGRRDWSVVKGPVTVVTNTALDAQGSNLLALARGAVETELPTTPGHRYQVSYSIHGPCAVGWWNGDANPLDRRARDLIGGNDGAFVWGATNVTPGFVGPTALFFAGEVEPAFDPESSLFGDDDDPVSKIELGDPENLRLTNSFTIEGWFRPTMATNPPFSTGETVEQIFFRGDSRRCADPYFFGIEQVTSTTFDMIFHIENANARDCGIILETSDQPVVLNQWQHLAAVFETQVLLTNTLPGVTNSFTNQLRLYLNGTLLTNVFMEDPSSSGSNFLKSFTWRSPFRDLDPTYSPGVSIGNRSRLDASEPYIGFMDELSVYARALTDPELAAIAAARQNGKFDRAVPPALSLAKARVLVDDVEKDTGYGDNSAWSVRRFEFTALRTNSVLHIESLLPGTLVDNITLTELPSELNYLPEQSLSGLSGKDGFGVWKLEIRDSRAGATNGNPLLVDWKLTFQLVPSNAPPVIYLTHGAPYTNTLVPSGVQNFVVEVPQWASYATNVLLSARRFATTNASNVGVLFDRTNHFPTEVTNFVFWPPVFSGTNALGTNTLPFINIGQPYYMTVTNTNTTAVTFAIEVLFDIIQLTNCQPLSNFVWEAGIPRYFQFDVPTNAVPTNGPPQTASFWLYGAQSNLTVVLSQHLPLPDLNHYDYISARPCTNNEIVMTLTNSTPYAVDNNRWYVGVFAYTASNSIYTNIPLVVEACNVTNYPTIIVLTNGIPYLAYGTNPFVAPPGPPRSFFFSSSM